MKEFFESVGKWFWDSANVAYSISHIVLIAVIVILILLVVIFALLKKRAHKLTKMYSDREQAKTSENASLKNAISDKDAEITSLLKKVESNEAKLAEAAATAKMNKEFARIFKESLLVSRKTSTIAVDTTNILDALSVDEIKEYASQIGAKIKSNMNKAEMIKVIRKTEVMRKNLEK